MTMDPLDFLQAVSGFTLGQQDERPIVLGTIDPAYPGTGPAKIQFDGETGISGKAYSMMGSYQAKPGDRVVLLPIGRSYLILGEIGSYEPPVRSAAAFIDTYEETSSTSYTDLATVGPQVSVMVGDDGLAQVSFSAKAQLVLDDTGNGMWGNISVAASGANTIDAGAEHAATFGMFGATDLRLTIDHTLAGRATFSGLTQGMTTFTMKYSKSGTSDQPARFQQRRIDVVTF